MNFHPNDPRAPLEGDDVIQFTKCIGVMEFVIYYKVVSSDEIEIVEVLEPWYGKDIWGDRALNKWQNEQIINAANHNWDELKYEAEISKYEMMRGNDDA